MGMGRRCFVHSDLARALVVAKRLGHRIRPREIPDSIVEFVEQRFDTDRELISFPAFNYDFGRTGVFDLGADEVQVGSLPEWVRRHGSLQRCQTPFFSTLSNDPARYSQGDVINPFGSTSHFQTLYDDSGLIVFLGTSIEYMTFLHFVEDVSGGPLYRYEKSFPGTVIPVDGPPRTCEVTMHVRPRGAFLEYDFEKIGNDLSQAGLLHTDPNGEQLAWGDARTMCDYLVDRIHADPLYLLAVEAKEFFHNATDCGRRRVLIEEFEDE